MNSTCASPQLYLDSTCRRKNGVRAQYPDSENPTIYAKHILVTLEVGFIEEVTWNDEAFELLVVDEGTKELVKAVVTNRLHSDDHADVIKGKGNGLFILLHG